MATGERIGWHKPSNRIRLTVWQQFQAAREARGMSIRGAMEEALTTWAQRQVAGAHADVVAPVIEEIIERHLQTFERRIRSPIVKAGYLATTTLEILLEQRRRNGHDIAALLREAEPRVHRRYRDARVYVASDLTDELVTSR